MTTRSSESGKLIKLVYYEGTERVYFFETFRPTSINSFSIRSLPDGTEVVLKTFRVVTAIDQKTGRDLVTEIRDSCERFWNRSHRAVKPVSPKTTVNHHGIELYVGQRSKERRLLLGRYTLKVIEYHYRNKLAGLFGNCCFKCKSPEALDMDHHLSMALGGHLEPGNIVMLCRTCNDQKRDSHYLEFYTDEELELLQPLLDREKEVLAFTFDWASWNADRKAYLLSLGISAEKVDEALHSEGSRIYVDR